MTEDQFAEFLAKVKNRVYNLQARYNLDPDDYELWSEMQDHVCAICGAEQDPLCVDHDHEAEERGVMIVRGLLCNRCNMGIGLFRDDPDLLKSAAEYLDPKIKA